jgi:predicted alpha/beta superfamily hydrolase
MRPRSALFFALAASLLAACGSGDLGTSSSGSGGAGPTSSSSSSSTGTGGQPVESLDALLAELRADPLGALIAHAADSGWPVPVAGGGYLFVNTDPALTQVAGDHDAWKGTPLIADAGFSYAVIAAPGDDHYKFTDGTTYKADPWSRSYNYDSYGEISIALPQSPRFDRYFGVGDQNLEPRTVRVWVPASPLTHVLYVHDGQNLFDPDAPWGGWHLADMPEAGMLMVGIDNTPARMDEYTHVPDTIEGSNVGGKGDQYADLLQFTVRPLIAKHYGEPPKVGVMGSSLGGLISFEIAYRYPGDYVFAASLSGTMGWGSIGAGVHNQTMIERYQQKGKMAPILYLDSGGYGTTCADSDGDGIDDDDANSGDNYCENEQMHKTLIQIGYSDTPGAKQTLYYWWEQGAEHNEAAWAARVFRPLGIFAGL